MADLVVGDRMGTIKVKCLRRDGTPFNLSTSQIGVRFRIGSGPSSSLLMTITDPLNGEAQVTLAFTNGTPGPGIMYVEFRVNDIATPATIASSREVFELTVRDRVS